MRRYCERALEMGIDYLAFTDHIDLDPADFSFGYYNFENARREFEETRDEFAGRLEIAFGVEVSCQSSLVEEARREIEGRPYDIVIGSVHILDGLGGDISSRENTPRMFEKYGPEVIYRKYLDEVEASIEQGLYDVIGHIGILKRHGTPYLGNLDLAKFDDRIERIAEKLAKADVALEVNSSGLWQPPAQPYPDIEFVKRFIYYGGTKVTVCSDAHVPENLGRGVPEALEMLKDIGVNEITVFKNRTPRQKAI
jgi:histidinol-phosphatase (PHP family)